MKIVCPLPAALGDISASNCPFRFDQIVRFGFTRRGAGPFASSAAMKLLATWTARQAAADDTKIVMSPFFAGMFIPPSEALTTGGNDNSTFNGIPEYNGEGFVNVTGVFKNLQPAVAKEMDMLTPESLASAIGISNLTLIMFNKDGVGFAKDLEGFPVYNFRKSSVGSEGFNSPNTHNFSFAMPGDWDSELVSFIPDFDPLTDL